jgi:hypothetical protein
VNVSVSGDGIVLSSMLEKLHRVEDICKGGTRKELHPLMISIQCSRYSDALFPCFQLVMTIGDVTWVLVVHGLVYNGA